MRYSHVGTASLNIRSRRLCSKKSTGSGSRIAASIRPLASYGPEGITIFKPGVAKRASIDCEWYSAPCACSSHRGPHDHRNSPVAVTAIAKLGDLVGDLVERHVRKVGELHLGHRPLTGEGQAQCDSGDGRLGKRCVDDPSLTEPAPQAIGDQEYAALLSNVLAQHHHAFVALHLIGERGTEGGDHVHLHGLSAGRWVEVHGHVDRVHVGQSVACRRVR